MVNAFSSSESVITDMKSVIRSSNELQSMSFNRSTEIRGAKPRHRGIDDDDDEDAVGEDHDDVIDDRMVSLAAQIK